MTLDDALLPSRSLFLAALRCLNRGDMPHSLIERCPLSFSCFVARDRWLSFFGRPKARRLVQTIFTNPDISLITSNPPSTPASSCTTLTPPDEAHLSSWRLPLSYLTGEGRNNAIGCTSSSLLHFISLTIVPCDFSPGPASEINPLAAQVGASRPSMRRRFLWCKQLPPPAKENETAECPP
ncbi:hypothetical protein B0H12DRAFT_518055 [Mycena haematopus]|nr:hypothetical protein B0H12DRAFT_518055 [Mycena haematopus]